MIATSEDHTPQEREILKSVTEAKSMAERGQKSFRERCDEFYGLHRNYRRLVTQHAEAASERDRDDVIGTAKREWGAELFIPYAFTTVETIIPRALMNDPTMKVKPKDPNVPDTTLQATEALFAERQEQINYSMILQPTARRGFKFGLGVQKTYWNRETRRVTRLEPALLGIGTTQRERDVVVDEGPMAEDVNTYDFYWDPTAKNIVTCAWVIHRTWRNMRYITDRIKQGHWRPDLDPDAIARLGSDHDRGDIWKGRMTAAGVSDYDTRQGRLHEVWEYHDGEQVHTVLDAALLVSSQPTPFFHRELPFQIFRPTLQEGEFVGIGEIEPIKHLQYELNALRSQRRDNATLVLQKAFMYAEGLVDPNDLVIGPGVGIPTLGNPAEVLQPIQIGEIPASGYQEEAALKEDIERTSGISDPISGGSGDTASTETATGIQLVQSALNIRVRQKTKNLELETIKPAASQWLELYRQYMREPQNVRVEDPQADSGVGFETVRPQDVRAQIEVAPTAGSTEPENLPQKRNDALALWNQVNQHPEIDQRKAVIWLLQQLDVADPEAWLIPQNPQLDAELVGQLALASGMSEEEAMQFVQTALEEQEAIKAGAEGSQNGASPEGQPAQQGAPSG